MELLLVTVGIAISITIGVIVFSRALSASATNYQESFVSIARGSLADMFVFVDPGRLLAINGAAFVLLPIVVYLLTENPVFAVGVAVLVLFGPKLAYTRFRNKRNAKLARQLPDGLAALAGNLRAGLSLPQALGNLAQQQPKPLSQEFELITRKQRLGMPLDQALAELEQRVPGKEFALFVTSVRIARELGGNLSESLDRLADTIRRKLAMEDKIDALTSQGKIQGIIVGLLPLGLMWVLSSMEPEAMNPLFTTPIGWAVLGVIGLLELVGFLLIRKIVRIDV
jgi:tight adherence protein B